jgi:hypothetical protein
MDAIARLFKQIGDWWVCVELEMNCAAGREAVSYRASCRA